MHAAEAVAVPNLDHVIHAHKSGPPRSPAVDIVCQVQQRLALHLLLPDILALVSEVESEGTEVQLAHKQRLLFGGRNIAECRQWVGIVLLGSLQVQGGRLGDTMGRRL